MWRELAVGASYTQLNTSAVASIEGTVPHPLVFDQRTVAPMELPSSYQERATHIHVAWVIPITTVEGLDVTISGGPTAFNLKRGAPGAGEGHRDRVYRSRTFASRSSRASSERTVGVDTWAPMWSIC